MYLDILMEGVISFFSKVFLNYCKKGIDQIKDLLLPYETLFDSWTLVEKYKSVYDFFQGNTQEMKVESTMDVTVQVADNHELSLAEFLDGCAKVANETTSVVRSTLEDIVVTDEKNKTNFDRSNQQTQLNQNEVPEKHGKTLYTHT